MIACRTALAWLIAVGAVSAYLVSTQVFGTEGWLSGRIDHDDAVVILLAVIATAGVHILGNIWHEVAELNDQLAGRSPEFHTLLRDHTASSRDDGDFNVD